MTNPSSQIKAAAEKATQGQKFRGMEPYWFSVDELNDEDYSFFALDADFISVTSPSAILSLIASHEAREKKLVEALEAVQDELGQAQVRIETDSRIEADLRARLQNCGCE